MGHKWMIGIVIAAIVGAPVGLHFYVKANQPVIQARTAAEAPVVLTRVTRVPLDDRIEAIGTARAFESIVVSSKVTEKVTSVHFEDAQVVRAGDVLVELNAEEIEAQLSEEQAALGVAKAALTGAKADVEEQKSNLIRIQANLTEAESQLARVRMLHEGGTAPKSQLDEQTATVDALRADMDSARARIRSGEARLSSIEAQIRSAEARVRSIEARLADRRIVATFDGITGFRNVSVGAVVGPGTMVTTLDDIETIRLDFPVPERFLGVIRAGQPIRARSIAMGGREFEGVVRSVDTRVDPATRSVVVRAEIANPTLELRPGMLLTVKLIRETRPALVVPEEAIVPLQDRQYVYTVADGKAVRREVSTGIRRVGIVEVTAGLEEGEEVVTQGTVRLRPGATVNVIERIEAIPAERLAAAGVRP